VTINWTTLTTPSGVTQIGGIACDNSGNTVINTNQGLYLSTNDGSSWTLEQAHSLNPGPTVWFNGVWMASVSGNQNGQDLYTSTNGTSWTLQTDGLSGFRHIDYPAGIAWKSGNNWAIISASAIPDLSTNAGSSWTTGSQLSIANGALYGLIWDGSQYAANLSGSFGYGVATSPDGTTWTVTSGTAQTGTGIVYTGTNYVCGGQAGVYAASTVAGLANATVQSIFGSDATPICTALAYLNGLVIAGDQTGNTFESSTGTSGWAKDNSPFATASDYAVAFAYDSTTSTYLGVGNFGTIVKGTAGAGIAISPTSATVLLGGTQGFTATGDDGGGYTWSAVYGTISTNGNYTAPSSPSFAGLTDTVTVALTDSPSTQASASVTIQNLTVNAYGKFVGSSAYAPVPLANAGTINPKIYEPYGQNQTVKA
jgi:hypothetical protein